MLHMLFTHFPTLCGLTLCDNTSLFIHVFYQMRSLFFLVVDINT